MSGALGLLRSPLLARLRPAVARSVFMATGALRPAMARSVSTATGALRAEPKRSRLAVLGAVCTVVPGLLIGASISKNMASFLEENDLFVPSDDDED